MSPSVVILSAKRTAIGDFGGALSDIPPTELGAIVARAAIAESGLQADELQQTVFGNVIHTGPADMYLSRVIALSSGVPETAPALTLNRLCGSGLQAVISASEQIRLGYADTALAGGAESMSQSGHLLRNSRRAQKFGDAVVTDMMLGALTDPFGNGHMGMTAENIADEDGINRELQDAFALESHRRATRAINEGRFEAQTVPVTVQSRRAEVSFRVDEHVRSNLKAEDLAKLRPVFRKDGSVTAGNASGLNDGAAAIVLSEESVAARRGFAPLARIVATGLGGVAPRVMGLGPIPAVEQALARSGLNVADLDVIESNEAFAAQACAVNRRLDLDTVRVNPNGGAIALGHPIGATGAILLVKLVHELQRIRGRYGLVTMCIGGGQGIAMIVEAL